MPNTAIVVLAAGTSSRMGEPKQLLPYGERTLVRHAVVEALASEASPVAVVVGANADCVIEALAGLEIEIVRNNDWQGGIGSSIHAGVQALQQRAVDNIILTLADQPKIVAGTYNQLIQKRRGSGAPIVASSYAGTVGVPVLFSRAHFEDLLALGPGEGCKGVILRHIDKAALLECPQAEADIDTPEDYARLCTKP